MALEPISLLVPRAQRGSRVLDEQGVVLLTFDAVVRQGHESSSDVSDYPREQGGDATDHVQPGPISVPMTAVWTATPLGVEAEPGRVRDVLEALEQLRQSKAQVTLQTYSYRYEQMVLRQIGERRTAQTGQALEVDLTWRQLTTVASETVAVPESILAAALRPGGKKKKDSPDATKDESAAQKKKRERTLAKVISDLATGG